MDGLVVSTDVCARVPRHGAHAHHVTRHNTPIHNILSTASDLVPKCLNKFAFNSVQSNSKRFLCTSVHFNVGTCCSSTDIQKIFKLLPRVYQHVRCYKLNCFNDT